MAWILFDWACQPVFTLITTFVFAPYFAARLASNAAEGQALWGYAAAAAGLCVALGAPILGALADSGGRRKLWIGFFSLLLVAGSAMLWFAIPGAPSAVAIALAGFVLATVGAELATVFTNAMMPDLVPRERLGRLSGAGWAAGYAGGLVSLVLVLGFLVAPPDSGRTLLGFAPAFGLDPFTGGGERATGPLTALWYVVFVAPLFLMVPTRGAARSAGSAIRNGLAELRGNLAALAGRRDLALFLLSNMASKDGLAALFAFGGIYAAGILGWTTFQIGLFGILLTVTGTLGAILGGRLDDRLGPKPVLMGSLAILILCCLGIVSTERDSILFVIEVAPAGSGGLFASPPEILYLILGGFIGAAAGPLQAAARTLLIDLSPRERMTGFFGLFALSGKATSFVGPFAVALLTDATGSQRLGISAIIVLLALGMILLARVRTP